MVFITGGSADPSLYDNKGKLHEIDKLKYPLKLVSPSFKGCYEDLSKPSYGDPNQGFGSTRRKKYR